jgi:hypothetical protein
MAYRVAGPETKLAIASSASRRRLRRLHAVPLDEILTADGWLVHELACGCFVRAENRAGSGELPSRYPGHLCASALRLRPAHHPELCNCREHSPELH